MMLSTSTPGLRRPSHTARPLPAARSAVPARTEAPVALDVVAALFGLLALLRQLATLTVVDVLMQWSRGGYDWHVVMHPDVVSPWIGVARPGCTILFAAGDRDLRALSQQGVTVNSPAIVEQLSAPRPRQVGALRLSLLLSSSSGPCTTAPPSSTLRTVMLSSATAASSGAVRSHT